MIKRKASTLTDSEIEQAFEAAAEGCTKQTLLGDPDKVRIAYAWLSFQTETLREPRYGNGSLNDVIRAWGGTHISRRHVVAAAKLLGLKGTYPYYFIKHKFLFPSFDLLDGIKGVFSEPCFLHNLDSIGHFGVKTYRTNPINGGVTPYESICDHLSIAVGVLREKLDAEIKRTH